MRELVHLRHGHRDPPSEHLSARGVAEARELGRRLGRFDRALASPRSRAQETAVELGRPPDRLLETLREVPDDVNDELDSARPHSFADFGAIVARRPTVRRFAVGQSVRWRTELHRVPDGGRLLVVSHAGVIELGAVAAVPAASGWGPPLGYLEGVRLEFDGTTWVRGAPLRAVP